MRTRLFALAALALVAAACEPARRDVQINWTFGGQNCSQAGVATIEIDIGGQYLDPGQFACTDNAGNVTTGVDLGRFLTGAYDMAVVGYDASGNIVYETEQTLYVREDQSPNVVSVDVPAYSSTGGGEGSLTLLWTFGGQSCDAAGVGVVNVSIDGTPVTDDNNNPDIPCDWRGTDGVTIAPLDTGTHSVVIGATSSNGTDYGAALSANIADGIDTQLSPNLVANNGPTDGGNPTDGGTPDGGSGDGGTTDGGSSGGSINISWSFAGMSCANAKVDNVEIIVDGTETASVACNNGTTDSGSVSGVTPGSHTVNISGIRGSGGAAQLVYSTTAGAQATVQNGASTHIILNAPASSPGTGGATIALSFPQGGPDCSSTSGSGTPVNYTLTSPTGSTQIGSVTCGGASGVSAISICNPGAAGCGAGSPGLAAGVWTISGSATGYSASTTTVPVPNDAVGSGTLSFTAN